jgi:hypothetical protein
VPALKDRMQMLAPADHAVWFAAFEAGQPVRIHNRNDLPEGLPERRFLEEIGVWSTLMLPLGKGDQLIGVLGYDSQTPGRIWTDEEVELLASVGRAVSAALARDKAAATEAASRQHLEATLQALPDLVVEITADGKLRACHSNKLPWLAGLVRAGLGRPLTEVLPEPLASVLAGIVETPPGRMVRLPVGPVPYPWSRSTATRFRSPRCRLPPKSSPPTPGCDPRPDHDRGLQRHGLVPRRPVHRLFRDVPASDPSERLRHRASFWTATAPSSRCSGLTRRRCQALQSATSCPRTRLASGRSSAGTENPPKLRPGRGDPAPCRRPPLSGRPARVHEH